MQSTLKYVTTNNECMEKWIYGEEGVGRELERRENDKTNLAKC